MILRRQSTTVALLVALTLLIGTSCGSPTEETTRPDSRTEEPSTPTRSAPATAEEPTTTSVTRAQAPTPSPTEVRSTPMVQESSTPTPVPVTPTPTVPPAPHFDVEQAPYAESACSDKYPCNDDFSGWEARMRVPPDFEISVFAHLEAKPTSITFGPDNRLYVAALDGTIYVVEEDGEETTFFTGLITPTGIAFQPGSQRLYVSSRVIPANVDGEAQVGYIEDGHFTQIIDGLPCCYVAMHAANGIAFGPDGFGYVGVGGRADHGEILLGPDMGKKDELHPLEASILRFSPDGQTVEVYAQGFRNPYDIAWDAQGNLFATDNGRDGNPGAGDNPPDELHLVVPGGQHGYPWYDCPVCFAAPEDVEVIAPLLDLIPHGAATGITAYLHNAFPGYYNNLFLLLWSAFEGAQNVIRYDPATELSSVFATGFAQPIDLTVGPAGHLYVADNATGLIFEIRLKES